MGTPGRRHKVPVDVLPAYAVVGDGPSGGPDDGLLSVGGPVKIGGLIGLAQRSFLVDHLGQRLQPGHHWFGIQVEVGHVFVEHGMPERRDHRVQVPVVGALVGAHDGPSPVLIELGQLARLFPPSIPRPVAGIPIAGIHRHVRSIDSRFRVDGLVVEVEPQTKRLAGQGDDGARRVVASFSHSRPHAFPVDVGIAFNQTVHVQEDALVGHRPDGTPGHPVAVRRIASGIPSQDLGVKFTVGYGVADHMDVGEGSLETIHRFLKQRVSLFTACPPGKADLDLLHVTGICRGRGRCDTGNQSGRGGGSRCQAQKRASAQLTSFFQHGHQYCSLSE